MIWAVEAPFFFPKYLVFYIFLVDMCLLPTFQIQTWRFGVWILNFGFWIVLVPHLCVAARNAAVWILDFA